MQRRNEIPRKARHLGLVALELALVCATGRWSMSQSILTPEPTAVRLPEPRQDGTMSLEAALRKRRSVREYASGALTLGEVSQLLWAAQGITDPQGLRTAPSAGALYPLEVYLVANRVQELRAGVYHYRPRGNELDLLNEGDVHDLTAAAALGQECVRDAAAVLVFTAVYERTTHKYGQRGIRYVHMEAGHAAQNVCLQAVALGLGAVTVGAFEDRLVKRLPGFPAAEEPLYLLPVGRLR
jgi:SagB-type dehydrogenase family enzyme